MIGYPYYGRGRHTASAIGTELAPVIQTFCSKGAANQENAGLNGGVKGAKTSAPRSNIMKRIILNCKYCKATQKQNYGVLDYNKSVLNDEGEL